MSPHSRRRQPAPVTLLLPHQVRPGDVILTDDEELLVLTRPAETRGREFVTIDVRSRLGIVARFWEPRSRLRVRCRPVRMVVATFICGVDSPLTHWGA